MAHPNYYLHGRIEATSIIQYILPLLILLPQLPFPSHRFLSLFYYIERPIWRTTAQTLSDLNSK